MDFSETHLSSSRRNHMHHGSPVHWYCIVVQIDMGSLVQPFVSNVSLYIAPVYFQTVLLEKIQRNRCHAFASIFMEVLLLPASFLSRHQHAMWRRRVQLHLFMPTDAHYTAPRERGEAPPSKGKAGRIRPFPVRRAAGWISTSRGKDAQQARRSARALITIGAEVGCRKPRGAIYRALGLA